MQTAFPPFLVSQDVEGDLPLDRARTKRRRYKWREMLIGESFHVPGTSASDFGSQMRYAARVTGFVFTAKTQDSGCRVWRRA